MAPGHPDRRHRHHLELQRAGWKVNFEPHALVWILMPETLRGLWKQRLRWAKGGAQMLVDFFGRCCAPPRPSLLPTYFNTCVAILWSYVMLSLIPRHAAGRRRRRSPAGCPASPHSALVGADAGATYLMQAAGQPCSNGASSRGMFASLFWMVWYPLAFW